MREINTTTVRDLCLFLHEAEVPSVAQQILTALISTGAEASSIKSVIDQLIEKQKVNPRRTFISLSANDGANLKALIKAVIQKVTSCNNGIDDDGVAESSKSKVNAKPLNYDLQILANHVKQHRVRLVTITFQDTEAFDSELLSDLIETLGYYQTRIPFCFIFCLATSVEFLQQRLSRRAVQTLNGRSFDVAPLSDEVEQVFAALIDQPPVWIGPNLMSMLFERQNDYIQSIDSLVDEVQYAYMCCYYANALSLFLDKDVKFKDVPKDHIAAVRHLPSFRTWYEEGVRRYWAVPVSESALEDDSLLHESVCNNLKIQPEALMNMMDAIRVIQELQRCNPGTQVTPRSKLYIQAMSNKLNGSSLIRSLLLSIRKAHSDIMEEAIISIVGILVVSTYHGEFQNIRLELYDLLKDKQDAWTPLRSEDDLQNSTLRTTVVAQKVELSKQKSTLSKEDAAYTKVLRKFTDLLEQYFQTTLFDPKNRAFHEIYIYDLKSPHREVFTPRPRHAIERALAAPHDYLDCDCCAPDKDDGDEQTLSASQPATAVLYQLYLESGSLINASDLWQAFQAVMGDERTEEQNMALFQRALAELKYLGLVKNTRKRVDHVAKVAWKGL